MRAPHLGKSVPIVGGTWAERRGIESGRTARSAGNGRARQAAARVHLQGGHVALDLLLRG